VIEMSNNNEVRVTYAKAKIVADYTIEHNGVPVDFTVYPESSIIKIVGPTGEHEKWLSHSYTPASLYHDVKDMDINEVAFEMGLRAEETEIIRPYWDAFREEIGKPGVLESWMTVDLRSEEERLKQMNVFKAILTMYDARVFPFGGFRTMDQTGTQLQRNLEPSSPQWMHDIYCVWDEWVKAHNTTEEADPSIDSICIEKIRKILEGSTVDSAQDDEGEVPTQPDEQLFYLLAADYSKRSDNLVWWGPNDSGYTRDLKDAGVYTFDQIHPTCWKDDEYDTIPVKKELVDALYSPQHVRHETKNLESLGIDMKRWWGKR
jgi:hypothetical protein